jgi:PhnB protein
MANDNLEYRPHPWEEMSLNWMTTGIICDDVGAAVAFYRDAMQFTAIAEFPGEDGKLVFARMRFRGSNFTISAPGFDSDLQSPLASGQRPSFAFYLYVDDAPAVVAAMAERGAEVLAPAKETFWGDMRAKVRDPLGYIWDVAHKIA